MPEEKFRSDLVARPRNPRRLRFPRKGIGISGDGGLANAGRASGTCAEGMPKVRVIPLTVDKSSYDSCLTVVY